MGLHEDCGFDCAEWSGVVVDRLLAMHQPVGSGWTVPPIVPSLADPDEDQEEVTQPTAKLPETTKRPDPSATTCLKCGGKLRSVPGILTNFRYCPKCEP